ncbi:hypothetical protein [Brevundimonas sp.]|uniref:hypothetical protein n=1 Tax=Brevundimonas sp. TaxID=1871086 RepID=UPI0035B1519C
MIYDSDTIFVSMENSSWTSLVDDEVHEDIEYAFMSKNGDVVAVFVGSTKAISEPFDRRLIANFEPDFLDHFAQSERLVVVRQPEGQEMTVVWDFGLIGTGAAVAALRRCQTNLDRENATRQRKEAQWDYIARDPFASPRPAEVAPLDSGDAARAGE